ncbi:MAG: UDP-N-acetylmuramate--L-alanine ligase [Acidimicrobiales bacterium]
MGEVVEFEVSRPRRIHVVGAGGSGMSAIAEVLATMGHSVTGSDKAEFPVMARLRAAGVDVRAPFDPANVDGADAVVASTAWLTGNVEVDEARARGIPVLRRAAALAAICRLRRTIAVAGTHGKTTTSAMLATILDGAGGRPSFVVGGVIAGLGTGARWDEGEWFVVEADESDGTFLDLPAEVAVVTSVEPDHLEHWGGFPPLADAFGRFVSAARTAVVCADDAGARKLPAAGTYGFDEGARFRLAAYESGRDGCRFTVEDTAAVTGSPPPAPVEVRLPVAGRYNARNASAALVAAIEAGVPLEAGAAALAGYQGVARRADTRGERDGVTYVDDYAHLPTEVASALAAAKEGGWRRVVCVFQPHRYSRTASLWRDFADAFAGADVLAVTDVYAAGEAARPGVTGKLIVDAVLGAHPDQRVAWLPARPGLVTFLRRDLRPGDLCLTLGAGDLTSLPDELLGTGR